MKDKKENKKLLFFDIDGTLIPYRGQMPQSTVQALQRAKAEGHQLFLCSGRSECSLPEAILEIGFDGIVSATGATIRYHGQRIRMLSVGPLIYKLVEVLENSGALYTLQTPDVPISPMNTRELVQKRKMEEFHIIHEDISANPGRYTHTEKVSVFTSPVPYAELAKQLAPEFEVTASSFDLKGQKNSCEITMTGVNKSSAMAFLGEYLGVSQADMIAFGDGPNDLDMLSYAGIGVAMGNAVAEAKAAADYITGPVTEDGIYYGLKALLGWE